MNALRLRMGLLFVRSECPKVSSGCNVVAKIKDAEAGEKNQGMAL